MLHDARSKPPLADPESAARDGRGRSTADRAALQPAHLSDPHYRAMFESSPSAMWTFDRDTLRFITVNDAAIAQYGYTRDEFAAMTLGDICMAEPGTPQRALADDEPGLRSIRRHRKKDRSEISVEVRSSDLTVDGIAVRLSVITDVTDRMNAEQALQRATEQLRQAQKMDAVGRLAGGIAHDFNNVLTVVQTYTSFLEESIPDDDARREDVIEIRRATERGANITRQLLTLSRHGIVAPRRLDVDALVAEFSPMLRRLMGEDIKLVTLRGQVAKVFADPGQIEQLLLNLASNARDAMPEGGRLTIESRMIDSELAAARGLRPGRYVELAVTDTGVGMDAETQRKIFEPFFTTKGGGPTTGLGLSIVHGIVTQAGGGVSVYSERGHGSTFRIHLPIADHDSITAEIPAITAPKTLPPIRVLVVDDQHDIRAVAVRILQEAGCNVIEAASADEARNICVSDVDAIDVVLLDVVLPDGRGEVLMSQLRDLRPSLRFVQMSGYPVGALTTAGAPPNDLLAKPFTPRELRAAVARAWGVHAESTTADGSGIIAVPQPNQRKALVADDDAEIRRAVARTLRRAGFEVVDVDSGFKAITALESSAFDVVVSDVQMPDGGGLDLLRAVRRIDLDVPVILMTGDPSVPAASAAVEYGAFRYLTKPLDPETFIKSVEHAARAHALARLRRDAYALSGVHAGVADRAGLEVRFDQALSTMWMAFQPIVHASNGALFGIEALMRSTEPSIPSPPAMLEAATQLGRLPMIGRNVRALSSAAISTSAPDVTLFVNLHPEDLHDADLIDASSPLSRMASRVILEVTERASLDSSPKIAERIARLRAMGFRLAVDDIGAGYSGLSSFTELTPEIVKIDMSLVRDVHKSALKQRTIGALCRLCKEVGTLVVGEGVETPEERDTLVGLGCDLLQGYLIGRPQRELP
ncbi:MAG: EAL domain-containing protein [Kofleriaceae bacterium]